MGPFGYIYLCEAPINDMMHTGAWDASGVPSGWVGRASECAVVQNRIARAKNYMRSSGVTCVLGLDAMGVMGQGKGQVGGIAAGIAPGRNLKLARRPGCSLSCELLPALTVN